MPDFQGKSTFPSWFLVREKWTDQLPEKSLEWASKRTKLSLTFSTFVVLVHDILIVKW